MFFPRSVSKQTEDFAEMIVDGTNDGGADILLTDPNSETADLVIGQSKFCKNISNEQVLNAVRKMADFFNDMTNGKYERFNEKVRSRFRKLYAELGDESKIHFVFYTSAPKNRINIKRIETKFREMLNDVHVIEINIFFAADVEDDIKESLLRKPGVEYGKIQIDEANNYLAYGDDAVIVNVFAFSIKDLPNANDKIPLANKSRTICVAFTALAARYHQGNITDRNVTDLISSPTSSDVYKMLRNLGNMKFLLPLKLYTDAYDTALDKLFKAIIKAGTKNYSIERRHNSNLTPNSFLQKDKNYYSILNDHWDTLRDDINEIFSEI